MEVKAIAKDTGTSPRKLRHVVDIVRGKKVDDALSILRFTPTPTARFVSKTIKSAASNAENNYQMSTSELRISAIYVDVARTLKRHRPRSRGRASNILKRSGHITVIVSEED